MAFLPYVLVPQLTSSPELEASVYEKRHYRKNEIEGHVVTAHGSSRYIRHMFDGMFRCTPDLSIRLQIAGSAWVACLIMLETGDFSGALAPFSYSSAACNAEFVESLSQQRAVSTLQYTENLQDDTKFMATRSKK